MSTEEQNWDLEAAEYVLGTLSAQDRKVYDALYKVDSDWQARVHNWQARLNPLHDSTPPVEPPDYILADVLERINDDLSLNDVFAQPLDDSPPDIVSEDVQVIEVAEADVPVIDSDLSSPPLAALEQLKESVVYWKMATVLALSCIAALFILGPRYLELQSPEQPLVRTVALLQGQANEPLWAVSYYPRSAQQESETGSLGLVSVTVIGEPQLTEEESHQLWMVLPENEGVRSVGLVPNEAGETATFELPIALDEAAEFAVSLEPLGGVPGPAHGPVVTRTFIIKAPAKTDI